MIKNNKNLRKGREKKKSEKNERSGWRKNDKCWDVGGTVEEEREISKIWQLTCPNPFPNVFPEFNSTYLTLPFIFMPLLWVYCHFITCLASHHYSC